MNFNCGGPKIGKTIIKDLDNGDTKVKVKVTSGPARHSFDVFWLCTDVSGGCHESSCGDIYLGSFKTDATGRAVFKTILPGGNPFPGKFVHVDFFDLTDGAWFSLDVRRNTCRGQQCGGWGGAVAGDPVQ